MRTLRFSILFAFIAGSALAQPKFTLLAVFAHPDDETVAGPLLAKYAKEGHSVHLITLTAGQKGVSGHAGIPAGDTLAAVRTKELACAVDALGLAGHTLLEFQDQGFAVDWDAKPMNQAAARIRQAIDTLKPDVVVTWGPDGATGHPDHRTASNVTTQAFQDHSLLKHRPSKLYYVVINGAAWTRERSVADEFITTVVDAVSGLDAAYSAMACHKSQWTPAQMQEYRSTGKVSLRLALTRVGWPAERESSVFERITRR